MRLVRSISGAVPSKSIYDLRRLQITLFGRSRVYHERVEADAANNVLVIDATFAAESSKLRLDALSCFSVSVYHRSLTTVAEFHRHGHSTPNGLGAITPTRCSDYDD